MQQQTQQEQGPWSLETPEHPPGNTGGSSAASETSGGLETASEGSRTSMPRRTSRHSLAKGLGNVMRRSLGRKPSEPLGGGACPPPPHATANGQEQQQQQKQQAPRSPPPPSLERGPSGRLERLNSVSSMASSSSKMPGGGVLGMINNVYTRIVGGRQSVEDDPRMHTMVNINVGGQVFATSLGTVVHGSSGMLRDIFIHAHLDDEGDPVAKDQEGNVFVDHDPKTFSTILNFLRANTPTTLPELGSREWHELRLDADFYGIPDLAQQMDLLLADEQARRDREDARKKKTRRRKSSTTGLLEKQGRELERMRVELHRLQFEKAKAEAEGRPMFAKMEFAYNLMVVGVTGTGKSSTLNTVLDQQVCQVSGSQAQGTRGCALRDGVIDNTHFISYLDTQGLGADTSISDEELLEQIMLSAESIRQMGIINNILISFDLATRTTPATMANQLTLCELFTELRRSCFLCFTKWNTNSVMSEWNLPLKKWIRKFRRARSIDKITQDPPSYEEMYRAYAQYLLRSLALREDGGAFAKMSTFLAFFESRVIWCYNLDPVLWEDKEDGELEPYHEYLYNFYRKRALITLKRGSTVIKTNELAFLKDDQDTMADVAARLIEHRDLKVASLDQIGQVGEKRRRLRAIFTKMSDQSAENMTKKVYDVSAEATQAVIELLDTQGQLEVGCSIM